MTKNRYFARGSYVNSFPALVIVFLSAVAILITLALPMIPWTAAFFEFTRPTPAHLGLILGLAVLYLVITELVKRPLARYVNASEKESHD